MTLELTFVPALLVILVGAGFGRAMSKMMRQPAIFGELLLGMILGHLIILSTTGPMAAEAPVTGDDEIVGEVRLYHIIKGFSAAVKP